MVAVVSTPVAEIVMIYQPAPTPGSDLQILETDAKISIPAKAREIYGKIEGFRDIDTWVRLDLPYEELPSFIQKARCTGPLVIVDPKKYIPGDLDPGWWQPGKATHLEECSGLQDYLYQTILVDYSNADMLTIYVMSIAHDYTVKSTLTPKP